MSFVHLHTHSHFSLLDGLSTPQEIAETAKEQGAPAVALTDHGNLFGISHFLAACKKAEIKPILGCEVYVAKESRRRRDAELDKQQFHLVLLAESYDPGWKNLMKLVSAGFLEGFYYKPRVDWELLEKHSAGLIASTACLGGELPKTILSKGKKEVEALVEKFQRVFPGRFFLEVQPLEHAEQEEVNAEMFRLAREKNLPVIASCDAHWPKKEDRELADILARIQTGTPLGEPAKVDIAEFDLSMRSAEEIAARFPGHPEVLENTLKIAERCSVEMPEWGWVFPRVER
jgi:DNA polymerase-3 subunit alpha